MNNSITYKQIEEQMKFVNNKQNNAITNENQQEWNTKNNKLGEMLKSFGRIKHSRERKINLILGIEEIQR